MPLITFDPVSSYERALNIQKFISDRDYQAAQRGRDAEQFGLDRQIKELSLAEAQRKANEQSLIRDQAVGFLNPDIGPPLVNRQAFNIGLASKGFGPETISQYSNLFFGKGGKARLGSAIPVFRDGKAVLAQYSDSPDEPPVYRDNPAPSATSQLVADQAKLRQIENWKNKFKFQGSAQAFAEKMAIYANDSRLSAQQRDIAARIFSSMNGGMYDMGIIPTDAEIDANWGKAGELSGGLPSTFPAPQPRPTPRPNAKQKPTQTGGKGGSAPATGYKVGQTVQTKNGPLTVGWHKLSDGSSVFFDGKQVR